jgi:hypothetical protein
MTTKSHQVRGFDQKPVKMLINNIILLHTKTIKYYEYFLILVQIIYYNSKGGNKSERICLFFHSASLCLRCNHKFEMCIVSESEASH